MNNWPTWALSLYFFLEACCKAAWILLPSPREALKYWRSNRAIVRGVIADTKAYRARMNVK